MSRVPLGFHQYVYFSSVKNGITHWHAWIGPQLSDKLLNRVITTRQELHLEKHIIVPGFMWYGEGESEE